MTTPLVIIGCGGFGREVHDVVEAINRESPTWDLLGYVDDSPDQVNEELVEKRGSRVLGPTDWLLGADQGILFVIGIGNGTVRRTLDERLSRGGRRSATLIHPAATVGYDVRVGEGSVLCAGVRATTNISIGRHVHLNINTTVGHDCVLQDYVTVNPLVAISGWVTLETGSMMGTHSAILQQLTVGRDAVVGAGSCVVKSVPDNVVAKGVPAKW